MRRTESKNDRSTVSRMDALRAALAAWPTRRWLILVACVAVPVMLAVAFGRLERYVHALPRYDRPLVLKWVDLPDWLRVSENRHVLDALATTANLDARDRLLDTELAARIGESLSRPSAGWVRRVERIRIEPDGEVAIKCSFREPAAWVRRGDRAMLVDPEAVRLPGVYDTRDCRDGALLVIDGVEAPAPEVGSVWPGADVVAALRLSALIAGEPFRHQIAGVTVANHDGRRDRSRPHIELLTDVKSNRIWWGRAPGEEFGTEITASQKVTLLGTLYRQFGRVDMNRAYVNIMTWPDRVAMPAGAEVEARSRLLRG